MAQGKTVRVPIPKGRDPFVNTPLLSLGPGANGEERFWISTWNACAGCLAVRVTESGEARIYRFNKPPRGGFYSAVQEDADTLWLCGDLSTVVRLTLSSGKVAAYPTGAPAALVFQGMALDRATGKLFAAAFPYTGTTAFSFDTRGLKPVKVYENLCADKYMRFSFPNPDGTHWCVLHIPGETLVRWDPLRETVTHLPFNERLDSEAMGGGTTYCLIADDRGRRYFPSLGWFDPATRRFSRTGPHPRKEMTWFARRGGQAWGCACENGNTRIGLWTLATGAVRDVCVIPDCLLHGVALAKSGKLVAVNLYGEFFRFDGQSGALEVSKRLPTDSVGAVDCLRRIDRDRLLGTPFITQRFWEVNLRTKKGSDCGRAAPGAGEILKTWKIGRTVYMAAYTGGELMAYDPGRPPRFPENPRVVAKPPGGMRPVAAADDGHSIFYACSRHYGVLGSVLTKYDTRTGAACYQADPLPGQQIQSLAYDTVTRSLLAGTTMHADCHSCAPTSDRCYFARIDAQTLTILEQAAAPAGTGAASVLGPMGEGRHLCLCAHTDGVRWFVLDARAFRVPALSAMGHLPKDQRQVIATGKPGFFIFHIKQRLELWDMRTQRCVEILCRRFDGYRFVAQGDSVYLIKPREITVLDGCLRRLRSMAPRANGSARAARACR